MTPREPLLPAHQAVPPRKGQARTRCPNAKHPVELDSNGNLLSLILIVVVAVGTHEDSQSVDHDSTRAAGHGKTVSPRRRQFGLSGIAGGGANYGWATAVVAHRRYRAPSCRRVGSEQVTLSVIRPRSPVPEQCTAASLQALRRHEVGTQLVARPVAWRQRPSSSHEQQRGLLVDGTVTGQPYQS